MSSQARFAASEAACYAFPGEDQGPLRAAFMDGSAWAATEIERLTDENRKMNATLAKDAIEIYEQQQQIERLRRELNLLKAVHESAEAEVRQLLDENGSLIAVCREFIDRWPTEEGIDNTIQRARAILLDHDLRNPETQSVNRALEEK